MADCVFCGIVEGSIPSQKVYEDENFMAFLDISPISGGHTLVVPKKHFENLLELPEELGCEAVRVLKKVSSAVVKAVGAQGFNVGMNNYEAAGQVVMHAHFHIIPRFSNDSLKHWPGRKASGEELDGWCEKIRREI